MQTVILPDTKRCSFLNAFLRAVSFTPATPCARICYQIPFFFYLYITEKIVFPENWIYTEIKILNSGLINTEYNSNTPGISGIYIGKIRLLFKYDISRICKSGYSPASNSFAGQESSNHSTDYCFLFYIIYFTIAL